MKIGVWGIFQVFQALHDNSLHVNPKKVNLEAISQTSWDTGSLTEERLIPRKLKT